MLKFCFKTNDWYQISIYSLCLTVMGGLFLRLQYAGVIHFFDGIDLRRSHSHLGFYGILFPLLWHQLQDRFWVPKGLFVYAYVILLILSTFGFATAGYGAIAHATSFLTLLIWLVFAFKNIHRVKNLSEDLINVIPLSIILSSIFIVLVLIFRSGEIISPLILVRAFLVTLLFGVFAPAALEKVTKNPPHGVLWIIGVLGFGFIMTGYFSGYLLLMPALIGVLIIASIFRDVTFSFEDQNRLRVYWLMLGFILLLISFEGIPNNHFTAVAGVHFFVFTIIIPSFYKFKSTKLRMSYELAALSMVALIYSQNISNWSYKMNQLFLAVISTLLIVFLLSGLNHRTQLRTLNLKKI